MGKRAKQRKSLNALKNLMEELSLGNNSSSREIDNKKVSPSLASSTKTKRFILDPNHPFYWHLSNRENRPKDTEGSSASEYPDSGSQSESKIVIKKAKNLKKRHRVRRHKKNKTKTTDLNICNQSNVNRTLNLDKMNRKKVKRTTKKLKNQKIKRRLVNKSLANELNQLSIL